MLYEPIGDHRVHCLLCHHHCRIAASKFGFCGVRQNQKGKLYTHAYGDVIAANVDPIEKKPLYHFLPGTTSFSVATRGCNFRCRFCQNWEISQISCENGSLSGSSRLMPDDIVQRARALGCRSISYTYTEPTIFFEYAYETAKKAKTYGLKNVFVTNGYMTIHALDVIRPYLDACNVDLKSFSEDFYKKICRGRLQPVLDTIRYLKELNIWVEITTLVVPGQNDDDSQLHDIAGFLAQTDRNIPWHISRFHPDHEILDNMPTPVETLRKARAIGRKEGLRFIYLGNAPGESAETRCSACGNVLIQREGFVLQQMNLAGNQCMSCNNRIAGVFDGDEDAVRPTGIKRQDRAGV